MISSAINLDSFSLYTRLGFVPNRAYQDMYVAVPESGLDFRTAASDRIREATLADVEAMAAVEMELSGIRRTIDYRYMIENREGFWHVSVCEREGGGLDGFMASCGHCGCNLIGPGVARTQDQAAALMLAELNRHRGRRPVFLAPVDCGRPGAAGVSVGRAELRDALQLRPAALRLAWRGVNLPTFMPETA